jgi:hypothetical protein
MGTPSVLFTTPRTIALAVTGCRRVCPRSSTCAAPSVTVRVRVW